MSECPDKKIAELLPAFELGLLSIEDRARVEQHIVECEACFHELQKTAGAARLFKLDPETRQQVREVTKAEAEPSPVRFSMGRIWHMATPVAVIAAVVLVLILKDWRIDIRTNEPAMAAENRLAILPFENLSQPSDTSKLGEIVANLMITGLSQSQSLQVVSSQYTYDLTQQLRSAGNSVESKLPEAVARKAKAKWLVNGSISKATPVVVLTAQIIDVSTGIIKGTATVSLADSQTVFAAIDQLSSKVRQTLLKTPDDSRQREQSVAEMTTSSAKAYEEYSRGVDFNRKFFTAEAIRHFQNAIALDSTFAMPYYYLSKLSPASEARLYLGKAVKYSDRAGERDRYLIESRATQISGDWKKTLDILNRFVDRFKDEKEPLLQLARTEYSYSMYPKAVWHLQMALALDSSNVEVWNQLAYTYERLDDFENAIRAIDRYVALAPNEPNPYDSRAEIYGRFGRLDQAIGSYQQALRVKPDFYPSLTALGIMSVFKGDYIPADSCFGVLVRSSNPTDRRSAAMYRSYVRAYQGQFRSALQQMDQAIHADSAEGYFANLPYRLYWKATVCEAAGNLPDALKNMERSFALAGAPAIDDVTRKIAYYIHLLAAAGRKSEALEKAEWLKKSLDSAKFYQLPYCLSAASISMENRRYDLAVNILESHQQEIDPFYDWTVLAKGYLGANRLAEAVTTIQKAESKYTPVRLFWGAESVKLHYLLGRAYEQSQWNGQAIAEYRKFLAIWDHADPGVAEVTDARARLRRLEQKQ